MRIAKEIDSGTDARSRMNCAERVRLWCQSSWGTVLIVLFACGAQANELSPDVIIETVSAPIVGSVCPRYTIRILRDGQVQIEVIKAGVGLMTSKSNISSDELKALRDEFHRVRFLDVPPIQHHPVTGNRMFDCDLDWDYIKQFPNYVEQCSRQKTVESNVRFIAEGSESIYFRDGTRFRRVIPAQVRSGREIAALISKINLVVKSEQWTGPNKCLAPI